MLTRRGILIGLALVTAGPALAQGKKGSDSDGMNRFVDVSGSYTANGLNPDGSSYSGTVEILLDGADVDFTWHVGGDTVRGTGTQEGRVLTVDWGDSHPVIYVIMDDAELHGTWADGAALEKLTPR